MSKYIFSDKMGFSDMPDLKPGDILELRDFSLLIPNQDITDSNEEGKWQLENYRLIDGTKGKMIAVNYIQKDCSKFDSSGMPPVVEIDLPLKGRYAIYMATPICNWKPIVSAGPNGVDMALDNETFINVGPEIGVRYGRLLVEKNREIFCFFKNVIMDGRKLKIRVPFGSFNSMPLGLVRASLSCIRFVRLDDDTPLTALPGVEGKEDKTKKPLIMVCDGFSHYFQFASIGECMDLRLAESYKNSDIKILMTQIAGPTIWKSEINNYLGENLTEEDYIGKRAGDVRACKYIAWSIAEKQEALRVQAAFCKEHGMEFHFSIRANLYFIDQNDYAKGLEKYMNGDWWLGNPDARLKNSHKLDYAKKKVRGYYLSLFKEVLENYEIDGINFDFTRWPPILSPKEHDFNLLITVAREVREMLDDYNAERNKHIKFSMTFVEGYNAGLTLEEQMIDFEGLMAEGLLDFVCVEAWNTKKYCDIAHRFNTPFYAVQDGESIHHPGGFRHDPLWVLPSGEQQDDPKAGEELETQPHIRNCLAPTEFNIAFDRFYDAGVDGISIVNNFMGNLTFRDSGSPLRVKKRAKTGEVYGQMMGDYIFLIE